MYVRVNVHCSHVASHFTSSRHAKVNDEQRTFPSSGAYFHMYIHTHERACIHFITTNEPEPSRERGIILCVPRLRYQVGKRKLLLLPFLYSHATFFFFLPFVSLLIFSPPLSSKLQKRPNEEKSHSVYLLQPIQAHR